MFIEWRLNKYDSTPQGIDVLQTPKTSAPWLRLWSPYPATSVPSNWVPCETVRDSWASNIPYEQTETYYAVHAYSVAANLVHESPVTYDYWRQSVVPRCGTTQCCNNFLSRSMLTEPKFPEFLNVSSVIIYVASVNNFSYRFMFPSEESELLRPRNNTKSVSTRRRAYSMKLQVYHSERCTSRFVFTRYITIGNYILSTKT